MKEKFLNRYLALFPKQDGSQLALPPLEEPDLKDSQAMLRAMERIIEENKTTKRSPILGGKIKWIDYPSLLANATIPIKGETVGRIMYRFKELAQGHPFQTEFYMTNAIPLPTNVSMAAMQFGMYLNSNPVFDVYGPAAAEAEVETIAMFAELAGYDKNRTGGYYTYGGTGGNDGALRIGVEKAVPGSSKKGIPGNVYVLSNELKHFSVDSVVADAGIGTDKNIHVRSNNDNSMNVDHLEKKIREIFDDGGEIAVIYATVGTTDAFGMDEVSKIKQIRDKLVREYGKSYKPHIHADLAMGGLFLMFNTYDFESNYLGIDEAALNSLKKIRERVFQVKEADSLIIDFHKLGYTPYLNSLFLVRDAKDFINITRDDNKSPYIGKRGYGSGRHTGETKECSRIYSSLAALANLKALGIEGYQVLLGNLIERSEQLKNVLEGKDGIEVLNKDFPGPAVLFRFYDNSITKEDELEGRVTAQVIEERNEYMGQVMEKFGSNRHLVFLGDTKNYKSVESSDGYRVPLCAMKAFMISPYTNKETIIKVAKYIQTVKHSIDQLREVSQYLAPELNQVAMVSEVGDEQILVAKEAV